MHSLLHGITPLPRLGIIRAEGEEAAQFLHGQLTQDFLLRQPNEARLAAFLSAKGRMQASFVAVARAPGDILLVCSRDLLAPTLKRLQMFVLRAKVKLTDASEAFALRGLAGSAVQAVAGGVQPPWHQTDAGAASIVHLYPADGQPRALWLAPADTPPPAGESLSEALWQWGAVRSGVALLSAPVVDAFVPQMLNYESVGGVNFKKGCYPGQEVVARSQYRGTLKRRTYLAHADAPLAAGAEVFHSGDASQPCGTVVQAAAAPAGGFDALISIQIVATASGSLHASAPQGPLLALEPLPYALLAEV
ncbi:folate-binding protein [Ramlibacter sp. H39-3-26]|uniref:CAF17-like 4Fe-4S cluster assembly/insertion protein YgfZ n=1 Tax=Curvibacter soli TaxID=3031331 RepID=UPI0023DA279D|nr:folate-binding protein [Ramlibacter sp. H39-3-26]MDF1485698.1 folate-binding protein [Ramlibacter sp. H39-3-26]